MKVYIVINQGNEPGRIQGVFKRLQDAWDDCPADCGVAAWYVQDPRPKRKAVVVKGPAPRRAK